MAFYLNLSTVKIGDKVGFVPAYARDNSLWEIVHVVAKNKIHVTVKRGDNLLKFSIKSGRMQGDDGINYINRLVPIGTVEEHNDIVVKRTARRKINSKVEDLVKSLHSYTDEQLQEVINILECRS